MNKHATAQPKKVAASTFAPASNLVLQRKCACGNNRTLGGECEGCARKEGSLQRKSADKGAAGEVPPIVHEVLLSSIGQPLDPATRAFMEPRFGHDFGRVRVHADAKAVQSARAVDALAYTVGRDVVFDAGRYAPRTRAGRGLLAHELAHVVQQGSQAEPAGHAPEIAGPSDASEREADAAARAMEAGDPVALGRGASLRIARATEEPQPGLVARAKRGFYAVLIESLRAPQRVLISGLRRGASALPQGAQGIVESIIDVVEMVTDIGISLLLAIVALNVGVASGLAGLVEGLFRMAAGLLTGIALFIAGIITGDMGAAKLWLQEVYLSIVGIPAAFKALYDSWMAEFRAASPDRQTIMIGELTGQVIALLVPFLLSGGGAAAGRTATVGEQVAGTAARARAASAWGSAEVIAGGGETTAVAGRGAGIATRGSLALEVKPLPAEVPVIRPVPRLVPPAPAVAAAPAGLQTGRTAAVGAAVSAGTLTRLAPDVLQEEETDEHGCRYEPIAMQFGRFPCHADFASSLSGDRREFRVTTPEGDSVDFDAMDHGRNLYEVKTGYGWLLNPHPSMQDRIRETRERFINQSAEQTLVAERCGRPLRWYFNQEAVARDFDSRIQPPVIYQRFNCDVDSDN